MLVGGGRTREIDWTLPMPDMIPPRRAARQRSTESTASSDVERGLAAEIDLSVLSTSVGFRLRLAQQALYEDFNARFAAKGLTPARYSLLTVLKANPGARQTAVGAALRIKQSNLVVLVNALQAEGLVERQVDPADRRNNRLVLAKAGQALLRRIGPEMRAMEAALAERLGPGLWSAVLDALGRLHES